MENANKNMENSLGCLHRCPCVLDMRLGHQVIHVRIDKRRIVCGQKQPEYPILLLVQTISKQKQSTNTKNPTNKIQTLKFITLTDLRTSEHFEY